MNRPTSITRNSAPAYEHAMDHLLEYFSKGGSIRGKRSYYTEHTTEYILNLFKNAWYTGQKENCMKLAFWTRDIRGGAGARQNFRDIIKWLATEEPDWVIANIHLIPEHGRWDDLKTLYGTLCERTTVKYWAEAISCCDASISPLAAKWANRQDWRLRNYLGLSPKAFRKLVSATSGDIVEKKMCSGKWEDIAFDHVPSVASARYRNAFKRNAPHYDEWANKVIKGEAKVNTSAVFPHDIIRTILANYNNTDEQFIELMETTFNSLPNYIGDPNARIMPICDFSGSMSINVSGSIRAMDVCLGLGLYCSNALGKDNPFYRKLIPFSSSAELKTWSNVVDAVKTIPDGYVGSTNVKSALDVLLASAQFWNVPKEKMVNTLLIMSDMQFDPDECGIWGNAYGPLDKTDNTVIEECMKEWEDAGYDRPKIVYWNLHAYDNQPATGKHDHIAMISGFSPSILSHVLTNFQLNPIDVMLKAIDKYKISIP